MQPFAADIVPSKRGTVVTLLLHSAAVLLCGIYFHGILLWCMLIALCGSSAYAWRRQHLAFEGAVRRLEIDTQGRAFLTLHGGSRKTAAVLQPQSIANPVFCLLVWQTEQGRVHQALLPDMVLPEAYRRILVWAHYGANRAVRTAGMPSENETND